MHSIRHGAVIWVICMHQIITHHAFRYAKHMGGFSLRQPCFFKQGSDVNGIWVVAFNVRFHFNRARIEAIRAIRAITMETAR